MSLTLAPSDAGYVIDGPPEWYPNAAEMDRLIVPYRGPYSALDAFIAGLILWAPSVVDGNMFLADWSVDNHKQFPTVRAEFIGKKGGVLQDPMIEQSMGLQTVSTTDGALQLEALYRSPATSYKWVSKTSDVVTHQGFSHPLHTSIVRRLINGHVPTAYRVSNILAAAALASSPTQLAAAEAYLAQNADLIADEQALIVAYFNLAFAETPLLTNFRATPVVPGKYWICTSTTSLILLPAS